MASPAVSRPKRAHIPSKLMRESLLNKQVMASTDSDTEVCILPDVNILVLGGQSILDRGKKAMSPVLDAIGKSRKKHQIVIGGGARARVRHPYHIRLDLGMALGGMAIVARAPA